jgi:hypothetical protein
MMRFCFFFSPINDIFEKENENNENEEAKNKTKATTTALFFPSTSSFSLSYARVYVYLQNACCVVLCLKSFFQKSKKKQKTCGRSAFSLFPHILKEKPSPALYFLARSLDERRAKRKKTAERERRGDEFGGRERSDIIR